MAERWFWWQMEENKRKAKLGKLYNVEYFQVDKDLCHEVIFEEDYDYCRNIEEGLV